MVGPSKSGARYPIPAIDGAKATIWRFAPHSENCLYGELQELQRSQMQSQEQGKANGCLWWLSCWLSLTTTKKGLPSKKTPKVWQASVPSVPSGSKWRVWPIRYLWKTSKSRSKPNRRMKVCFSRDHTMRAKHITTLRLDLTHFGFQVPHKPASLCVCVCVLRVPCQFR